MAYQGSINLPVKIVAGISIWEAKKARIKGIGITCREMTYFLSLLRNVIAIIILSIFNFNRLTFVIIIFRSS